MCANEIILPDKQKNKVNRLAVEGLIINGASCLAESCKDFCNCSSFSMRNSETFPHTCRHDLLSFKYSTSNFFQVCNSGIFSKQVNELVYYIFLFCPGQFCDYKFWFK